MPRKIRHDFTGEFNQEILDLHNAGGKRSELVKEYDLTPSTFDKWGRQEQLAYLLIIVGNAGRHFMDIDKVRHYYQEARDLYQIYKNDLMLMKTENYL